MEVVLDMHSLYVKLSRGGPGFGKQIQYKHFYFQ